MAGKMPKKHDPNEYKLQLLTNETLDATSHNWVRQFDKVEESLIPGRYRGHLAHIREVMSNRIGNEDAFAYGLFGPASDKSACAVVTVIQVKHKETLKLLNIRLEPVLDAVEDPDLRELAAILAAIIAQIFKLKLQNGKTIRQYKILCDGPLDARFVEGVAAGLTAKKVPLKITAHNRWVVFERA